MAEKPSIVEANMHGWAYLENNDIWEEDERDTLEQFINGKTGNGEAAEHDLPGDCGRNEYPMEFPLHNIEVTRWTG